MQIAKNGIGIARPNPSVGAVVVYNNIIVGEGFTSEYGGNHAEVNAINSVKNPSILKESTLYVTLEPCSHFGKTPPCSDLIIKHQIKRVVIGCIDDNPVVSGRGIAKLKNANIEVIVGVLEDECKVHHRRFFTVQNKKRPYIILKWAETQDGFIAPTFKKENRPVWISNQYSQQLVHKWRAKEQAILVGTNTVIDDNPKLNVRSWSGYNPVRIVLDRKLRIPKTANVFDNSVKTIFIVDTNASKNEIEKLEQENSIFETLDFSSLEKLTDTLAFEICQILQKHNIQSIIIEGGAKTLQAFINANLWDEARVFVGDINFESGVEATTFKAVMSSEEKIKNDTLKTYFND